MKYARTILTVTAVLALVCGAWTEARAVSPPSGQQKAMTFSVDLQGPTAAGPGPFTGLPDGFAGIPIDEGCILTPTLPGPLGPNPPTTPPGPLPPPSVMVTAVASPVGSVPGGLGVIPSVWDAVEVDALSYGRDSLASKVEDWKNLKLYFSVDEFAMGIPGSPAPPNVASEGAAGALEASADVFAYIGPPPPVAPGPVFGNNGVVDGNAMPSASAAVYPGVGLIEPNPPSPQQLPDSGDNLDALDMNTTLADVQGPIYFSLDSQFADPREVIAGPPPNTGTAFGNGFVGGDVLVTSAGGIPVVYAPAIALGLDLAGPDSDDLDALALWDDGDMQYTPGVDLLLFSVRRGSAVIGSLDSMWGAPIEEGDVLTVPIPGGLSLFPAIIGPAEAMGLATVRSGLGVQFGDDLDALDVVPEPATLILIAAGLPLLLKRSRR